MLDIYLKLAAAMKNQKVKDEPPPYEKGHTMIIILQKEILLNTIAQ